MTTGNERFPARRSSPAQRELLKESLGTDRIESALQVFETLGVRGECELAARENAEAAVAALQPVELEPARKAELEQLARFASERRA